MEYNFDEHKHRYAIWTAARVVQRSLLLNIAVNWRQFEKIKQLS